MRLKPAAFLVGFSALTFVVTVLAIGFYNYRTLTLAGEEPSFRSMLVWQGIIYGFWIPVGFWVWQLFRSRGLVARAITKYLVAGALIIPLHAILSMLAFDTHWATPGSIDLKSLAAQRAHVDFLLYASFGILALAAFFQARAAEEAESAADLKSALGAARVALARKEQRPDRLERMQVSVGSRGAIVEVSAVEWFGSAGNYVVVNWNGQEGLIRESLQNIERGLDPDLFARAHRGSLVNLSAVAAADSLSDGSWRLTMKSGAEIVVSRTYRDAILARLGRKPSSSPTR
ncbi:MAG TPA: LytTR family DNA-binding domain-containing protein [Sphingomicrobium sp.]|jgi:hypothetical protein